MTATQVEDRNGKLGEYLEHLQSMALELERSMHAVAEHSLVPLEDSIANQQSLATRLSELANDLGKPGLSASGASGVSDEQGLLQQIHSAAERLQSLNQCYAALLTHSSHSVGIDDFAFSFFHRTDAGGSWLQVETSDLVLPGVIAMGGLNTSLYIGVQALEAAQGALNATSNNIANSNTPGYTREVPQISENAQTFSGGQVSGGGVTLDGLQSVRDELLNLQIQQQTSAQSSVDTQSSSLQQIQTYFASTGGDIASALSSFSTSLAQLSANPSSAAVQQGVVSAGQNLASAFNGTANGLTSTQSAADAEVSQTVAQINTLTQQIAQLNGQVQQLTAAGQDGGTVAGSARPACAAAFAADRHLRFAEQQRRGDHHRQWKSARGGDPELCSANDNWHQWTAAGAGFAGE